MSKRAPGAALPKGRDPALAKHLHKPVADARALTEAIAEVLARDGSVEITVGCWVTSPKREVAIVQYGSKRWVALLSRDRRGAPERVDHARGVELYRGVLSDVQQLVRSLRSARDAGRALSRLAGTNELARRVRQYGLESDVVAASAPRKGARADKAVERIAAALVKHEHEHDRTIAEVSVILQDARSSRFSRRRKVN